MCAAFEPCKVGTNNSLVTHPHYPTLFMFNAFEVGTTVYPYLFGSRSGSCQYCRGTGGLGNNEDKTLNYLGLLAPAFMHL